MQSLVDYFEVVLSEWSPRIAGYRSDISFLLSRAVVRLRRTTCMRPTLEFNEIRVLSYHLSRSVNHIGEFVASVAGIFDHAGSYSWLFDGSSFIRGHIRLVLLHSLSSGKNSTFCLRISGSQMI